MGGPVELFTNGHFDGYASPEQARSLPLMSTWGLSYLWVLAERVHVRGLPRYGRQPPQ